jgi:hypothetical protein
MGAMVLRGKLSKLVFFCLFPIFVLAMSINETKITVFALPIGLMITAIVGSPPRKRLSMTVYASVLIVVGGVIFVPLYNFFSAFNNYDIHKGSIQSFLSNPAFMAGYLDTKASVGSGKEAGRVDALIVPLQVLSKDPVQLGFGLGIGNATRSSLGPQFSGQYEPIYGIYSVETSMATFILETGVFGAILVLVLHWMIFQDAVNEMRQDSGLIGTIALGWIATSVLVLACNFYITTHTFESISYMFWFFSGLIASNRVRRASKQRNSLRLALAA